MATLTFQRASWCLQISRTSRAFAINFTTALPRRHRPRHIQSSSPATDPIPQTHTGSSRSRFSKPYDQARSAFTSTRIYQAQQAQAQPETSSSPSGSRPPASISQEPSRSNTTDTQTLTNGLNDQPLILDEGEKQVDWSNSFHGLSTAAFSKEAAKTLLAPLATDDIEIKPDGIIYLPEIKYRRILNTAFGPGAWGLAPRGETIVTAKAVTREYALVALGRLVSVARGEQDYFSPEGIPTAAEGCKSNALMRCCKDLGVASELWDPRFIQKFLKQHTKEVFVEHQVTKRRKKIWLRKDDDVKYPFKETKGNFGN